MDNSKISLDYSNRRPTGQAWRATLHGHTTYAPAREQVLELHQSKMKVYEQIDDLLSLCAAYTTQKSNHAL
ncbi:MAG: hypothetical protein IJ493_10665 [Clostridia bacterium]|nr:hypothetical protein [Clostridia bacterium]